MILLSIPRNCTHGALLQSLANVDALDAEGCHFIFDFAKQCFVSSSAIAFLCAWGMRQRERGCRFTPAGDYNVQRYLSRMDLFKYLDCSIKERFDRHTEVGRFFPIQTVDSWESAYEVVNQVCDLVLHQFDNAREFLPAMEWAVNEVVDNIINHSETAVPGAVCAQYFPKKHRLDIGICDMGRGIYASLSESQELISHGDAITKALQRGVTRNKDVGQGNGLAGSLDISRANNGGFQIWSGDVCFELNDKGKEKFVQIPETTGTGILIRLDTRHPVNLADTFIGDRESTFIFAESERVSESEGLRVLEECVHTGAREPAKPLRRKILSLLPDLEAPLILNFVGINSASSSFLDELLGRLFAEIGPEAFGEKIRIVNSDYQIMDMVNVVTQQRVEDHNYNRREVMSSLPIRHLSARVPWHDNRWNGRTCKNVLDNSFCRILARIDTEKNPDTEPQDKLIDESYAPPCLSEKGTFMSPYQNFRKLIHAWKDINPLFKDFKDGTYQHKPFSINAIPFLWMMKNKGDEDLPHHSAKAITYELDYDVEKETEIDAKLGFKGNIWVQHPENQKELLDSFFGCLKPKVSLIFFYCKHTPLSEPNERVIVGVAKVRNPISPILDYQYPQEYSGHKSYPWDRCVEHTLTDKDPDGFLLPYHELLERVEKDNLEIDLHDFAVHAPDYLQFSYASELVEHDTAIDALLNMAESFKKIGQVLGKPYDDELAWIDREVSKIWDMRGAFPGMGPVLSSINMQEGNTIAWEIERYLRDQEGNLLLTDPWNIFEESLSDPDKYIKGRGGKIFSPTNQVLWQTAKRKKKEFYKLLSRCYLTNDQADLAIKMFKNSDSSPDELIENLYLLYEQSRFAVHGFNFDQIDKALIPPEKVQKAFPLPEGSALKNQLDLRRARALTVSLLEEAARDGHSLLVFDDILNRLIEKQVTEAFPVNEDILAAYAEDEFFQAEIDSIAPSKDNPLHFLKLQRLCRLKKIILQRINLDLIFNKPYSIEQDWLATINSWSGFPPLGDMSSDEPEYEFELEARKEKAESLRILANYRFSVLIGPAGSGKTSLLEIFENLPEIKKGGVLKLAPTGKARVKLGRDAQTIAQFLHPDRYDGDTGTYHPQKGAKRVAGARNIIIDEASMLTEEQLAAVFDALGPVERIILVGDYRQLPPIGTGRPFVDIVNVIKPEKFDDAENYTGPAYAELRKIMRQARKGETRYDVSLSRCFGDEPNKEDLDLFHRIASGSITSSHLRLEKWYEGKDFRELFEKVLVEELNIDTSDVEKSFNLKIGAVENDNGYLYFNHGYAEKQIDNWQIISPINGYAHGVKEINKQIQGKFRRSYIDLALNLKKDSGQHFKRVIAKPKGSDNIVYGDKVINLRNSRWRNPKRIKQKGDDLTPLNYIANGEIGVVTGYFRGKKDSSTREPDVEIAFSTQPGYSYAFWPNQLGENGQYLFELAYAITVHKSQGSGFKTLFFVLPSSSPILCRELLYTALTRQEEKIVILHQGDFRDFIRYASSEASATARRFTDLFYLPTIKQYNKRWYDANYINISEKGEPMISKNEVIIANSLHKYADRIMYAYEEKLKIESSGWTIKPDFTVDNLETNKRFFWEHLGMMTKANYRERWEKKYQGYLEDGFVLHTEATPDDEKVLIITEENPNRGINSEEIDRLIREVILEE